jgi:hypothetical protein
LAWLKAWVQGHMDDCIRRGASRGFVPSDKLIPEQRLHLERRGLLNNSSAIRGL